jgi:hypothetical protein
MFYLDIAYVLKLFSSVFANVSVACFKCFICLQTYVASVVSKCFKSRLDVVFPSLLFAVLPWCLLLACILLRLWRRRSEGRQRGCAEGRQTGHVEDCGANASEHLRGQVVLRLIDSMHGRLGCMEVQFSMERIHSRRLQSIHLTCMYYLNWQRGWGWLHEPPKTDRSTFVYFF